MPKVVDNEPFVVKGGEATIQPGILGTLPPVQCPPFSVHHQRSVKGAIFSTKHQLIKKLSGQLSRASVKSQIEM
jgi:hypothetical protein